MYLDRSPPCPPGQPPMSTNEMIAMARPFWFLSVGDVASRTASALLQTYETSLTHENIVMDMQWAHVWRRDLAQFLLHRIAGDSREGRTADQILQSIWWLLSKHIVRMNGQKFSVDPCCPKPKNFFLGPLLLDGPFRPENSGLFRPSVTSGNHGFSTSV